ncbi:protocatechuate 3,4-dioxygenase subunit alpha [Frankia sp. AgKG'84/4]|uniref:protocatechuate 3,4-dioxygenase subunit alpha n=1 Tax=Frankia sp. AgKG'84/4 TaxID=573490 RepID=UPI0020101980|nr:protocatechuate 3,4-dioxygenase subunit alpha [Frankia sp. AgKG'84/4]MCL9796258.1 protocatechuate 3,4-dioxygenase subunit alpha [Frankia sp. AgKG'84/4]
MTPIATPGQTVGPFFHLGLSYDRDSELVPPGSPAAIVLRGRVLDGDGLGVPDALVEIWQARPDGTIAGEPGSLRRDGWTFTGFGRASTGPDGTYAFTTVAPGPTEPGRAAFLAVAVFARGLLNRLFTRAYLPGDTAALAADPLLSALPEHARRTLVAEADGQGFVFDIRLRGPAETVFLRYPGQRP